MGLEEYIAKFESLKIELQALTLTKPERMSFNLAVGNFTGVCDNGKGKEAAVKQSLERFEKLAEKFRAARGGSVATAPMGGEQTTWVANMVGKTVKPSATTPSSGQGGPSTGGTSSGTGGASGGAKSEENQGGKKPPLDPEIRRLLLEAKGLLAGKESVEALSNLIAKIAATNDVAQLTEVVEKLKAKVQQSSGTTSRTAETERLEREREAEAQRQAEIERQAEAQRKLEEEARLKEEARKRQEEEEKAEEEKREAVRLELRQLVERAKPLLGKLETSGSHIKNIQEAVKETDIARMQQIVAQIEKEVADAEWKKAEEEAAAKKEAEEHQIKVELASLAGIAKPLLAELKDPTKLEAVKKAIADRDVAAMTQLVADLQKAVEEKEAQTKAPQKPSPADIEKIKKLNLPAKDKQALVALISSRPAVAAGVAAALAGVAAMIEEAELTGDQSKIDAAGLRAKKAAARITGMLRFGAISKSPIDPNTIEGLPEEEKATRRKLAEDREKATAAVLRNFKDFPDLATTALDAIQTAEHPEAFAGGIEKIGKLLVGNFGGKATSPEEALVMARTALKTAGLVGGDFVERMAAYYETDASKQPDPLRDPDPGKTGRKYANAMGGTLIAGDGGIQLDTPEFKAMRDSLHFHPDSLKKPLPALVRHIEKFRKDMANEQTRSACNLAMKSIVSAPEGGALSLVRKTLGQQSGPIGARDAKKAVLSAALTPLTQGPVGSCFATCNCMDYQENKPSEFMGDLCEMVKTGKLTKGGDPIPVVQNIPPGDHGLLRSFEYTVATLGARAEHSDRKASVRSNVHNGLVAVQEQAAYKKMSKALAKAQKDLDDAQIEIDRLVARNASVTERNVAVGVYNEAMGRLNSAIAKQSEDFETLKIAVSRAVTWEYDPTMVTEGAGTSADGSSSQGGWVMQRASDRTPITNDAQLKACLQTAFKGALGANGDDAQIALVVGNPAFLNVVKKVKAGEGTAFRNTTGGQETPSKRVLTGRETETNELTTPENATGSAKAKALLTSMVNSLKNSTDKTTTLTVNGIHAERALPQHPSLDVLKSSGDIDAKVESVFAETKTKATTPLDNDHAQHLFEKSTGSFLKDWLGDFEPTGGPLTGPLKPKELKARIIASATQHVSASFTPVDAALRMLTAKVDAFLVNELFPQFVIADTNWGGVGGKTFHVIAPDLETGEPSLYKKDENTGALTREDSDFVEAKWKTTTNKTA